MDEIKVMGKLFELFIPHCKQIILLFQLLDILSDFAVFIITFDCSQLSNFFLELLASLFIEVRNHGDALINSALADSF